MKTTNYSARQQVCLQVIFIQNSHDPPIQLVWYYTSGTPYFVSYIKASNKNFKINCYKNTVQKLIRNYVHSQVE